MNAPKTPVDKQAALFLSRKRHCDTLQEALEGAVNHLVSGKISEQLAAVFAGGFGPEPSFSFQITIRQDPTCPGTFSYMATSKVTHDVGKAVRLYGLKP